MKCKSLRELWGGLFSRKQGREEPGTRATEAFQVTPLTAGLRIDTTVPSGAGQKLVASQFIWVSPAGSDSRPVKALRVLLFPN
jgi:hypothetical protein